MVSILVTLLKEFMQPIVIAFLIAAPAAAWLLQIFLQKMEYRIELAWWMFALAGGICLAIAALTTGFNGMKSALENPVKSLNTE